MAWGRHLGPTPNTPSVIAVIVVVVAAALAKISAVYIAANQLTQPSSSTTEYTGNTNEALTWGDGNAGPDRQDRAESHRS